MKLVIYKKTTSWILFFPLVILTISLSSCNQSYRLGSVKPKVIVIAFEGIDPDLLERYIGEGKLPHFSQLKANGTFTKLETTIPVQSSVTWASFATGMNPGKHGIFDFLNRNQETYMPHLTQISLAEPKYFINIGQRKIFLTRPKIINSRKGEPFWKIASRNGIRCTLLRIPFMFPPDKIKGESLSGLGISDIPGIQGSFSFYTIKSKKVRRLHIGEETIYVKIENGKINTFIHGPLDKLYENPRNIYVPLELEVDRKNKEIVIRLQNQIQRVKVGQWSDWFEVTFTMNFYTKFHGVCRFYLKNISPNLELYLSPINFNPGRSFLPISYPFSFSRRLFQAVGLFNTQGSNVNRWALNEIMISERAFLENVYFNMNKEAEITLFMLKHNKSQLFISVFMAPEEIQQMFWSCLDKNYPSYNPELVDKYDNIMLQCYQNMDSLLGQIMDLTDNDTVLIVLSTHGFCSSRKVVNLNTWLAKNDYMTLLAGDDTKKWTFEDLLIGNVFWPNVDWLNTRAYALGSGAIYINLKGREILGNVDYEQYDLIRDKIINGLKQLKDPETGEFVIHHVYKREQIFTGPYLENAPDLMVTFNDGYKVSWQTLLGGMPKGVVVDNTQKYTAGYSSLDPKSLPGFLMINKKIQFSKRPRITDIAPMVLKILGVAIPKSMDGVDIIN